MLLILILLIDHCRPFCPANLCKSNTPEQSGKAMSIRAGGVNNQQMNMVVSGGLGVNTITWLKQIQSPRVCRKLYILRITE